MWFEEVYIIFNPIILLPKNIKITIYSQVPFWMQPILTNISLMGLFNPNFKILPFHTHSFLHIQNIQKEQLYNKTEINGNIDAIYRKHLL